MNNHWSFRALLTTLIAVALVIEPLCIGDTNASSTQGSHRHKEQLATGKLEVSTKKLKFSTIGAGGSQVHDLVISNAGEGELQVEVGLPARPFNIASAGGNFTLGRGESRTVKVGFYPVIEDGASAKLEIKSSDPDRPAVKIKLKGASQSSPLHLSKASATPGETLSIEGASFDPNAPTYALFVDQDGNQIRTLSHSVTTSTVFVTVPPWLTVKDFRVQPEIVSVLVAQGPEGTQTGFGPKGDFRISGLPETGVRAGLVTRTVLEQLQMLLESAATNWQMIGEASSGTVDTSMLRSTVRESQRQLLGLQVSTQSIIDGEAATVELGHISGRRVFLDHSSLALLDSMIVAYFLNGRGSNSTGSGPVKSELEGSSDDPINCPDTLACIRDEFNASLAQSTQAIFDRFHKHERIGLSIIGVATLASIGLFGVPAGSAILIGSTVGAILYFLTIVVPAVAGLSAVSFAAPFIELELGHAPTLADYQPALTHLKKGSEDFIVEEAIKHFGKGILISVGADEALVGVAMHFFEGAQLITRLLDPDAPESLPSQAFSHTQTIFEHLTRQSPFLTWQVGGSVTINGVNGAFAGAVTIPRLGGSASFGAGPAIITVSVSGSVFSISGSGFGSGECFCFPIVGAYDCRGGGTGQSIILDSANGFTAAGPIGGNLNCTCSCNGRLDVFPVSGSFSAAAVK